MSISSFSSDDIDLCDIEVTSDMEFGSPRLSHVPMISAEQESMQSAIIDRVSPPSVSKVTQEDAQPLLSLDSLVDMAKLIPGLVFDEALSVFNVRGSITRDVREHIYAYASRVGEITLTDDIKEGKGRLAPNVFLCFAQLQTPERPLFPSLHHLRIINADASLEYMRLFVTPSLRTLEVVGVPHTRRETFLSFSSAAVIDVPDLDFLKLGPGHLPRDILNTSLTFLRLRRLELVDASSALDYGLLQDIGRLEYLESLSIDGETAEYSPSASIVQAELVEAYRMKEEDEEQMPQWEARHMKEAEEEQLRQREAAELAEVYRRKEEEEEGMRQWEAAELSCRMKEEEEVARRRLEEQLGQEGEAEQRFREDEEQMRQREARHMKEAEEEQLCQREAAVLAEVYRKKEEEEEGMRQWEAAELSCRMKEEEEVARRRLEEQLGQEGEAEQRFRGGKWGGHGFGSSQGTWSAPVTTPKKMGMKKKKKKSQGGAGAVRMGEHQRMQGARRVQEGLECAGRRMRYADDDHIKTQADDTIPQAMDEDRSVAADAPVDADPPAIPSSPLFSRLSSLSVRGGAMLIQDLVQGISSISLRHLSLALGNHPGAATPSIPAAKRIADVVDYAAMTWTGSLAHVALLSACDLVSAVSHLPAETLGKVAHLPELQHLEIKGWSIDPSIVEDICSFAHIGSSRLGVLHLPDDVQALGIPFARLPEIMKSCPNLNSLRCRFDDISTFTTPLPSSHNLETLAVGNCQPHPDAQGPLEVARYLDLLFPNLKQIVPLDGPGQNAEQWGFIFACVQMYQKARRDERYRLDGL